MIAWAGAERLAHGLTDPLDTAPRARWPLDETVGAHAAEPAHRAAPALPT
jgi:N6-L-threonylcarbamoyladenine synthase